MKKALTSVFLILFFLLIFPEKVEASILFRDNFNDGYADGWDIDFLTPADGDNKWDNSKWEVNNSGEYGIAFADIQMRTISSTGDSAWDNYIYVIQLIGKSGVDKNIVFRYKDKNNWYNFHLRYDGIRFGAMNDGNYSDNNGKLLSNFSLKNNVVYRLKVIIDKDTISLFVNNQRVIGSLKIPDNFISKGKIGLYASTGNFTPHTSVWFDNIIVCTLDDPNNCDYSEEYFQKSPVIFIPGHGASINFEEMFLGVGTSNPEDWQMMPGVHVYDNLINTLEYNGYEKDKNLFTFYYNWLDSIDSSAIKLHTLINSIVNNSPTGKIDIIGHSMGGLVGRACVQNNDDHCFIDRLITVGTPHKGVVETYGAWEGGEVWRSGLSKLAFELFLNTKQQIGETKKEVIRKIAPSTQDMLPVFPYLKDINGNFLSQQPANSHLSNNNLSKLLQATGNNVKFIYGKDRSTLRWLTVTEDLSWMDKVLGNWQQHGKPITKEHSDDGDGIVLELSANPQEAGIASPTGFSLSHREIISQDEAVKKIMENLNLEATSSGTFQDNDQDFLVFYLHSPAHLEIESLDNLPPRDVFKGEENGQLKLAIIANPLLNQEYVVGVIGDEEGKYVLTVGQVSSEQSNWEYYRGEIVIGQTDTFKIKFNPQIDQRGLRGVQVSAGQLPLNELINSLRVEIATQSSLLAQKFDNLESLISISPEKALEYIYQIRNLTTSLYKSGQVDLDIQKINSRLESIAVYLSALAKNKPRELINDELELNFQDAREIVNSLIGVPYSDIERLERKFSLAAAFDFSLAQKSLKEASGSSYPAYLLARKIYFLGRNSKVLVQ